MTQITPTIPSPRRWGPRRIAALRALATPKGALAGGWLIALVSVAVLAPYLTSYDYDIQDLPAAFTPPDATHWFGTDEFGRDLLTRMMYGARTSLSVSSVAIGLSVFCGMILGAAAGYFGGWFDRVVTIVVDLTWSFPEILVALILVAIIGPGVTGTMIAIGVAYLAQFTRLTRAQIMAIKSETYIEAARSLGASHRHILFRHLIPNALAPVLVVGDARHRRRDHPRGDAGLLRAGRAAAHTKLGRR